MSHAPRERIQRSELADVRLGRVEPDDHRLQDAQGAGDAQDVLERRTGAGFDAIERRDADAGAIGDLARRQAADAPPIGQVPARITHGTANGGGCRRARHGQ